MRSLHLLTFGSMATSCAANGLDWSNGMFPNLASATCYYLKAQYPNITILPSDTGYTAENEVSWNAGAWLGPACVVAPYNAQQMSSTVKTLAKFGTPFAMRGGGHMPVENAANINSTGVLISSTNLKTLELSDDQNILALGPGYRWGDAYIYLNATQTGKMVVGGRYAPVGVPGYLLGGGISFFSYEYGFSSTNGNVQSYECVLADGKIVEATAENEYADLYWALMGGGNSFCLVTTFRLRTFDSPGIGLANPSYGTGADVKQKWLTAILNNAVNGSSDPKVAIIPVARLGVGIPEVRYDATLFHNSVNNSSPASLSDFQGGLLPASATTNLNPLTMAAFARGVQPAFQPGGESFGLQQVFHVVPHKATLEAMTLVHDTFFSAVEAANLTSLSDFFVGVAWNSITTHFVEVSNRGIGNPMGVAEEPAFWVEEAITWGDAADSPRIKKFIDDVNAEITTNLEAINATIPYIYLNDADETQDVFGGYPKENVQRLKSIRDKYDPKMVYTKQMPGGHKVAYAS